MSRLDRDTIARQYRDVQASGLLDVHDDSFVFYDFNFLDSKLREVSLSFGTDAVHTVAVKANPLTAVLKHISRAGHGLECASFQEVLLARNAGARCIAWDSPAKTIGEVIASNEIDGLYINANGLGELDMIVKHNRQSKIALRINALVSTKSHASMTVSGDRSKFGESISNRKAIINSIVRHDGRVSGIHVHSGSQASDYTGMAHGVRKILDLTMEINALRPGCITWIDIGGGFPAPYKEGEHYELSDYSNILRSLCPELFDGSYTVLTEFGRFYHANTGWTASMINEVKHFDDQQVIITHLGADMFVREAYNSEAWHHDFMLIRGAETVGNEAAMKTDIGGPLCFGGDYIARNVSLPAASPGDWLIIRDTGANTFALWSRHCSRPFPKVIGIGSSLHTIRERDTFQDILNFWS